MGIIGKNHIPPSFDDKVLPIRKRKIMLEITFSTSTNILRRLKLLDT